MRWVAVIAMIAGCDYVVGIRGFDDGVGDDANGDAHRDGTPGALCPMYPGMLADSDGDGVGDLCDPHPGKRDCLVFYSAFTESMLGSDWQHQNDSGGEDWTHCSDGGGTLLCSPRTAVTSTLYYLPQTAIIDAVLFEFEAYTVGTTSSTVEVSAAAGIGATDIFGRTCGLKRPLATGMTAVSIADHIGAETPVAETASTSALFDGGNYRVTWLADVDTCEVRVQGGQPGATVLSQTAPPGTGTHLAMRVSSVDINVDWVAAYSTHCPL